MRKILIVEDKPGDALIIREYLQEIEYQTQGEEIYEVDHAENAA